MIIDCDMDIEMLEPTGDKPEESKDTPEKKWPF